jgi:hypothetical protein
VTVNDRRGVASSERRTLSPIGLFCPIVDSVETGWAHEQTDRFVADLRKEVDHASFAGDRPKTASKIRKALGLD